MNKSILLLSVLFVAQSVFAEKLTLNPNQIKVQCKDPKHLGENVKTAYRHTYVKIDRKGTFQKVDHVLGAGGGVVTSCQKAEALEIQIYLASQQNKNIEFDTETFKGNVAGQLESSVVTVDPNKIKIECKDPGEYYKDPGDFFGKVVETAYRVTTIRIDNLKRNFNDYSTDPVAKFVVAKSQCQKANAIKEIIAKAGNKKIDIDLNTFEAKLAQPSAPVSAASSAPMQ